MATDDEYGDDNDDDIKNTNSEKDCDNFNDQGEEAFAHELGGNDDDEDGTNPVLMNEDLRSYDADYDYTNKDTNDDDDDDDDADSYGNMRRTGI